MTPWWMPLIREQWAGRFADFRGATASITLPISDRLITTVAHARRPSSIQDLEIRAHAGNRLTVSVRLQHPSWLPPIGADLAIERQPQIPDSPVLVLRLLSRGILALFAGPAARMLNALPSWLRIDGDLLFVDVAKLLEQYGAMEAMSYLRRLEITTRDGVFVVAVDAEIPTAKGPASV